MKIYTREEIIQALKACTAPLIQDCENCPLEYEKDVEGAPWTGCLYTMLKNAAKILEEMRE